MPENNRKTTGSLGRWKKGETGNPRGRPRGVLNKVTLEAKQLAGNLIHRPKYQMWLADQLDAGTLAPELQRMLWHYHYGVPRQSMDLNMTFDPAKYLARDDEAPID